MAHSISPRKRRARRERPTLQIAQLGKKAGNEIGREKERSEEVSAAATAAVAAKRGRDSFPRDRSFSQWFDKREEKMSDEAE